MKNKTREQKVLTVALALFGLLFLWGLIFTILFFVQVKKTDTAKEEAATLAQENTSLNEQVLLLTEQNTILSATVTSKVEAEKQREEEDIKLFIPDGIPVNGTAMYTEETDDEGNSYLEFTADMGTEVIATGSGTVTLSEADPEWGYRITIDHGNGYSSSYHVRENPKFIVGSEVRKGDVLFAVTKNNRTLEYSVYQEGKMFDPLQIMEVFG